MSNKIKSTAAAIIFMLTLSLGLIPALAFADGGDMIDCLSAPAECEELITQLRTEKAQLEEQVVELGATPVTQATPVPPKISTQFVVDPGSIIVTGNWEFVDHYHTQLKDIVSEVCTNGMKLDYIYDISTETGLTGSEVLDNPQFWEGSTFFEYFVVQAQFQAQLDAERQAAIDEGREIPELVPHTAPAASTVFVNMNSIPGRPSCDFIGE